MNFYYDIVKEHVSMYIVFYIEHEMPLPEKKKFLIQMKFIRWFYNFGQYCIYRFSVDKSHSMKMTTNKSFFYFDIPFR